MWRHFCSCQAVTLVMLISLLGLSECQDNNTIEDAPSNTNATLLDTVMGRMDSRIRPVSKDGPLKVECGFHIMSFSSLNEAAMDYKMTILFREKWMDSRLAFEDADNSSTMTLSSRLEPDIWLPDIYFPNEKHTELHSVTVPNYLIKIYPNGTVMYSIRLTLQLSCPMKLAAFPMDSQDCAFKMETFASEKKDLELGWMAHPYERDEELELPQFEFGDVELTKCHKSYKLTGVFSCLKAVFTLNRNFGFFILQTYVPSSLNVVISWVSFWISKEAVPARISLAVTTVLSMTTQLSGSTRSIPSVSYPKAIDVWLTVCMIFVFGSLLEYAFVNALSRKYKKERYTIRRNAKLQQHDEDTDPDQYGKSGMRRFSRVFSMDEMDETETASMIDKVSRAAFPAAFLLFNLVYWPTYLNL